MNVSLSRDGWDKIFVLSIDQAEYHTRPSQWKVYCSIEIGFPVQQR